MRRTSVVAGMWGLSLLAVWTPSVRGANCALNDPKRQIDEMFPGNSGFVTMEAKVGQSVRAKIERILGSRVPSNDLGIHRLYKVLEGRTTIGFVHARSEVGKSGVVQFVWAMDLDLSIKDFRVQRCREKYRSDIKGDAFRGKLVGHNLGELKALLRTFDTQSPPVPPRAASLARLAVLSGVKCRIITEVAFANILDDRLKGNTRRFFPRVARIGQIEAPFRNGDLAPVKKRLGHAPSQIDPASLVIRRVLDRGGQTLGTLVYSRWSGHAKKPEVWWVIAADGALRTAVVVGDVDATTRKAFGELRGKGSAAPTAGAAQRCAAELLAMVSAATGSE